MSNNKGTDESFERFLQFNAMYDASYKVCRNVRWKDSTINFEENRIETILNTIEKLDNDEYEQLVFSCFRIIERGKPRDIRACHINDRLVQNALCEQVLLPELTPKFIYDNCATLKGKGIDFALERVKKHLQAAQKEYGMENDFYGGRIDIRKFFDSIDHKTLKRVVRNIFKDNKRIAELACYFIDTFSYKLTHDKNPQKGKQYYIVRKGKYVKVNNIIEFNPKEDYYEYDETSLGLGSQTSQLFALLVLNEIDHYVKEQLHIKYYGRYMDDIYLLHSSKEYLQKCNKLIAEKLAEIGLEMNIKKTTIVRIHPLKPHEPRKEPFKYLKWNFYITTTGKIIQLPFREKRTQERQRLRKMQVMWLNDKISTLEVQQHYKSWRAHLDKGDTYYFLQDMDNYFKQLFKGVDII